MALNSVAAALLIGLTASTPAPAKASCGAEALHQREIMREALSDVARHGLRGKHHFSITFETTANGVVLPPKLVAQNPQEMTIILQHQFERLAVTPERFEVTLWFKGAKTRVAVPFNAVKLFIDPSVNAWMETDAASRGQSCLPA